MPQWGAKWEGAEPGGDGGDPGAVGCPPRGTPNSGSCVPTAPVAEVPPPAPPEEEPPTAAAVPPPIPQSCNGTAAAPPEPQEPPPATPEEPPPPRDPDPPAEEPVLAYPLDFEKFWQAARNNPHDFTAWTELLQYVEQEVIKNLP